MKKHAFLLAFILTAVVLLSGCADIGTPAVVAPSDDIHTDLQYAYLLDDDFENIEAYAKGKEELSRPKAIVLDFSEEEEKSDGYVLEYAYDSSFQNSTIVSGLNEKKASVFNLETGRTVYYRGATSEKKLAFAAVREITIAAKGPRNLYISGVSNVRDVGGYSSCLVEGGKIRQGLCLRGANLNSVTEKGKAELLRLGIKHEIDLRDSSLCKGPYVPGVEYDVVTIPSGTESTRFEEFDDEYTKIFNLLADAGENPTYLHCTAGADRTGICVFMLLTVCGAGYEDVARDYLFTNFSVHGSRRSNFDSEFNKWWAKLDNFEGKTKADKAKAWLISKGVSADRVEKLRETFVEGYKR